MGSNHTFTSPSPAHTEAFAIKIGRLLQPGDVLLLEGDLGAGKSLFARALIQSLLETPEDVPSPSFTIIQTYETARGMIWHSDLYRLSSTQEIEELGLIDAFDDAICLIEWPDRLGDVTPPNALMLTLKHMDDPDHRQIKASWTDPKWSQKLEALL